MRRLSTHLPALLAALLTTACGHSGPLGTLATQAIGQSQLPGVIASSARPGVTASAAPMVSVTRGQAAMAKAAQPVKQGLASAAGAADGEPAVPDEMIVHFKGAPRALPGADLKGQLGLDHTYVYTLKPNAYSLQSVDDWENAKDIDYVEPNFIYHVQAAPNDPNFSDSWGVGAINAPDVWGVTQGDGITVAVVDTGVSADNPDLAGQVLPGINLLNNTTDASDDHGHGTHVAGTIAAIANNGIGVAGVAPHAKILPIKVLDSSGSGTNETIANGILEAVRRGARVINLSLGGTDDSQTIRGAIAQAESAGVVVVCAAGNDGNTENFFPAACDGTIAVGALDHSNQRAYFSNYGNYVNIAAPGVNIGSLGFQGGIASMSGTSMAAPHVAGTAALLLSAFPQLNPHNVLTAMQRGGHPTTGFSMAAPPVATDAEGALDAVATLDLQAPGSVQGLTGLPGIPGEVDLSWQAASDNIGVTGYRIWRNAVPVGTTASLGFHDAGVNGSATYTVTAYDADGNESAQSAPVTVSAGQASSLITTPACTDRGTDHLVISWQTSQPMRCQLSWGDTANLGQQLPCETTPGTSHSMRIDGLRRFHAYSYRVTALDATGTAAYSDLRKSRTKIWWLF